jgi:hypothetical protein
MPQDGHLILRMHSLADAAGHSLNAAIELNLPALLVKTADVAYIVSIRSAAVPC